MQGNRQVVQIEVEVHTTHDDIEIERLYALCDDDTIWVMNIHNQTDEQPWRQLPYVPDTEQPP